MKNIYLIFGLLFFSLSFKTKVFAQGWLWGTQGYGNCLGGQVNSLAVEKNGDVYVVGGFQTKLTFGSYTLDDLNNNLSAYIAKLDSNGNTLWAKCAYSSSWRGHSGALSVASDGSGNAYVTGYFLDTISVGSFSLKSNSTNGSVFLLKFDPAGNVLWANQAITASKVSDGSGNSVAIDNFNNIYIFGTFTDTISFGSNVLRDKGWGSVFLVKYNSFGNVLWATQAIASNGSVTADDLGTDEQNNIYLTGNSMDSITFGSFHLFGNASGTYVIKYTSGGSVVWAKQAIMSYGYPFLGENSLCLDGGGNLYVAGTFIDSITFGPIKLYSSDDDVFLTKYSSNGTVSWSEIGYSSDSNQARGLTLSSDSLIRSGCYIGINSSNYNKRLRLAFGEDTFKSNTNSSDILIQIDANGKAVCGNIFNTSSSFASIGASTSGRYIYWGGNLYNDTVIFSKDTLRDNNFCELPFLARWNPCGMSEGVGNISYPNCSINLFPNPNNGRFNMRVGRGVFAPSETLEIYNIFGEEISSTSFNAQNSMISVDISSQPSGIYLYRIINEDGGLSTDGKFVIKK